MPKSMMREQDLVYGTKLFPSLEDIINNVKIPEELKRVVPQENNELEFSVYRLLKGIADMSAAKLSKTREYVSDIGAGAFVNVEGTGYIVVLHYDPANPEHNQHIEPLNGQSPLVGKNLLEKDVAEYFLDLGIEDGAILVRSDGTVEGTRIKLSNFGDDHYTKQSGGLSPRERRGLPPGANCRVFSAHDMSSYALGTVVYVAGASQPGQILRMENGVLTFQID